MFIKLIIILALLFILSMYFLFRFLLFKPKRSKKVPDFYKDTPHYKASRKGMAYMETIPCEDVYIKSFDGLKLHGYYYPAEEKSDKFLLGIHGYKSYARPEFGPYIKFYRERGFNVLLPDDRAHGPSEGKYIGFGVLDQDDCISWCRYIAEKAGEDCKIILHGVSMGGATVAGCSGREELPKEVKGIVDDCGYTGGSDILIYQTKSKLHLPSKIVVPCVEFFCRMFAGYNFHTNVPLEMVKKAKVPVLFVHGKKDDMVPYYMGEQMYDACTSKKKFFVVDEAAHAECIALEPEKYEREIAEFFDI